MKHWVNRPIEQYNSQDMAIYEQQTFLNAYYKYSYVQPMWHSNELYTYNSMIIQGNQFESKSFGKTPCVNICGDFVQVGLRKEQLETCPLQKSMVRFEFEYKA